MDKIYFYDLGVRNILIDNLKLLSDRNDVGQLWENFLVVERMKKLSYQGNLGSLHFWRTYTGAELDLIEDRDGILAGYEFKFKDKVVKAPTAWRQTYENTSFSLINRSNYQEYIT